MMRKISLSEAQSLPRWRRPEALLFLMAAAMPLAFSTWSALLNNFVIEVANFTGKEIGWLHSLREVPGFLAIGVIFVLLFVREQVLAMSSLILLGVATALTAHFPGFGGIMVLTLLSSIGFHYFETVNQSLQLQWIEAKRAPQVLGRIVGAGAGASLLAYLALVLLWDRLHLSYEIVYLVSGGATVILALAGLTLYPQFEAPVAQHKTMILRRRYWLYYALQMMAGARRQIFTVFAAFMMVERFGMQVHEVTSLFIINYVATMAAGPFIGNWIGRFGDRAMMLVQYAGLLVVFLAYGGLYAFGWGVMVASALYILDHFFFTMNITMKTYFQKIADPADIAPTAAVAFTINHIAAVFLPAVLGYLWVVSPASVFYLAAGMAAVSLVLSAFVPKDPSRGHETIFARGPVSHPAE